MRHAGSLLFLGFCSLLCRGSDPIQCSPSDTWTSKIGEKSYLCVVISTANATDLTKVMMFTPTADDYTKLVVRGSQQQYKSGNAWVRLVSSDTSSFQRIYQDFAAPIKRTSNVLTAVLTLNNGKVQGITWDDGCYFCGDEDCFENSYWDTKKTTLEGSNLKTCAMPQTPETDDLTIYVVWSGTDSSGNFCKSQSKRFSRFQAFSAKSYITSARDKAASSWDEASQKVSGVISNSTRALLDFKN